MFQKVKVYILIFISVVILLLIFRDILSGADNSFTDFEFKLRGPIRTDSTIITIYIDKAIMDSLGQVPLRWEYYTKLIDDLSNLGVKAIGIENVFDKNDPNYSSQASLLVSSVKNSGRVCVGVVFNRIKNNPLPDSLDYNSHQKPHTETNLGADSDSIFYGRGLETPFYLLLKSAAGYGHLNFENSLSIRKIPLILSNADSNYKYIQTGELVPAFALELLRIYYSLPKDSIVIKNDRLIIRNGINTIKIPTSRMQLLINYCGGSESLNKISFSDFLYYYNSYFKSKKPSPVLNRFKGKIVLIGMMGNRTSQIASTPFDSRFPFIGIHANILDTIIRERFLYKVPSGITYIITIVLSFLTFWLIARKQTEFLKSLLISCFLIAVYLGAAYFFFRLNIILSVQPVLVVLPVIIFASLYQYNIILRHSREIEIEKQSIESTLHKSRRKISALEQKLRMSKTDANFRQEDKTTNGEYINDKEEPEITEVPFNYTQKSNYGESDTNGIIFEKNSKMDSVYRFTKKIAPTNATVIILGESGTGKELIAKAIHNLSERKSKNFIAVNCGAIPETLLESELFGHEEGAFTGASKLRKGYFEVADQGTIFLDEITETGEMFQTKLLRVLQSGEFNRIGGTQTIKSDVRVIAASNKNIEELVKVKKFREDLYYRLNVIKIVIPNLRSRKGDIPLLSRHFLNKEDAGHMGISKSVMETFLNYDWPGNIRQLENVIKRSAIMAKLENSRIIQMKNLPSEIVSSLKTKFDFEGQVIEKLREKRFSRNSINETANELGGINRGTISEYFRGICFREFSMNNFDIDIAAAKIASSGESEVVTRVKNKMVEYLSNLFKNINKETPIELQKEKLRIRYKKLPNRYYEYLEKIIEEYYIAGQKLKYFDRKS